MYRDDAPRRRHRLAQQPRLARHRAGFGRRDAAAGPLGRECPDGRRQGRILRLRDRGALVVPRTADDSWDIATSVGATAVMVALARARETASADPLIRDPFAEPLVSTPELEAVREQVAAWWAGDRDDEVDFAVGAQQMINYQAVRTHFFDAYFAEANKRRYPAGGDAGGRSGLARVPLGMAGRHRRLRDRSTQGAGVQGPDAGPLRRRTDGGPASGSRRPAPRLAAGVARRGFRRLPVRRRGWPKGCCRFCPRRRRRPCSPRSTHSAGRAAGWPSKSSVPTKRSAKRPKQKWAELRAKREARGEDTSFNPFDLWFDHGGRSDPADWFAAHGWATESVSARDEADRLGRPPESDARPFVNSFVTATKS